MCVFSGRYYVPWLSSGGLHAPVPRRHVEGGVGALAVHRGLRPDTRTVYQPRPYWWTIVSCKQLIGILGSFNSMDVGLHIRNIVSFLLYTDLFIHLVYIMAPLNTVTQGVQRETGRGSLPPPPLGAFSQNSPPLPFEFLLYDPDRNPTVWFVYLSIITFRKFHWSANQEIVTHTLYLQNKHMAWKMVKGWYFPLPDSYLLSSSRCHLDELEKNDNS